MALLSSTAFASRNRSEKETGLPLVDGSVEDGLPGVLPIQKPGKQPGAVESVSSLSHSLEKKDESTAGHSARMTRLAERLAAACHCSDEEIQIIRWAGLLHDIGKIGIPDTILRRPGALSEQEWGIIRKHPDIGAEIVQMVTQLSGVAELIRSHHEHFDGSGYPRNLAAGSIPMGARILAVADAYTAMTDGRFYRPAVSHQAAIEELERCAGSQFDPWVVGVFINLYQ
jgi:putative nucleotidyltransferase with HDIG domain